MADIRVSYAHPYGVLWACWDDPKREDVCTDVDPDANAIVSLDVNEKAIAFEDYGYVLKDPSDLKIKVHHDRARKSLTVWFADPDKEHKRNDPVHDVVLIKDGSSRIIGVEKLDYSIADGEDITVSVETFVDAVRLEWIRSKSNSTADPAP